MTRPVLSLMVGSSSSILRGAWVERREIVEVNLVLNLLWIFKIDGRNLQKCKYRSPSLVHGSAFSGVPVRSRSADCEGLT